MSTDEGAQEKDEAGEEPENPESENDANDLRDLRRSRNREHARLSRERKRKHTEFLQQENAALHQSRNAALHELAQLRELLAQSQFQGERLRQWIEHTYYSQGQLLQQQAAAVDPTAVDQLQQAQILGAAGSDDGGAALVDALPPISSDSAWTLPASEVVVPQQHQPAATA